MGPVLYPDLGGYKPLLYWYITVRYMMCNVYHFVSILKIIQCSVEMW